MIPRPGLLLLSDSAPDGSTYVLEHLKTMKTASEQSIQLC
jgi:hypothetical protein